MEEFLRESDEKKSGNTQQSDGWGALAAFGMRADAHGDSTRSFSVFTIFFIILALCGIGYYTYHQVQGATGTRLYVGAAATSTLATTTVNVTATPESIQTSLVAHLTFDGMDMDWTSSTAEVVELTTKPTGPTFICGTDTVSDADANVYDTVQVGAQCWMAQNLRVGTRIGVASNQTDNGTIEKYCYSDTDSNCTSNNPNEPDGGLYQWDEAMQYSTTPGAQGICPAGWHIPTHDELTTLERALCTSGSCATDFPYDTTTTGYRGTNEGTKLKAGGSSGLEFNLAGIAFSGSFYFRGDYGNWWSSSPSGGNAWYRYVYSGETRVNRGADSQSIGFSVRCLQDFATSTLLIRGNAVNIGQTNVAIGKTGQGLKFNGTTSYVDMSSLPTLTNYTYALWIKPTAYTNGATSDGTGTYFVDRPTATNALVSLKAVGGNYHYQFRSNTGTGIGTVAGGAIKNGEWQHVVWGKNGTEHFIYVNGVKSTTTGTSDITPPTPRLGAHQSGAYFDGVLDDFRVFDRALSDAEVAELYGVGGGSTIKICKESSVQDADGNWYNTLAIGSQCWLDRNMNVGTRIAAASNQTDNSTIEKYCYSNTDSNCTSNNPNKPDGGLYQWSEAMQYSTTEGARGICPSGFHIPTDAEWHTLENFLTDSGQACSGTATGYHCAPAGTKLQPGGNSRFEGNRAGYAGFGSFSFRGSFGYWWSSSPSGGSAWLRLVRFGVARVSRVADTQSNGVSVRCLQD